MVRSSLWAVFALILVSSLSIRPIEAKSDLEIAHFWCDITPPLGHPLCGGWIMPVVGFDDPEYAKGVILRNGATEVVLCSLDWCQLRNHAYDYFRETLAKALEIPVSNVAVHCVHQHNAPIIDLGVETLIPEDGETLLHADYDFIRECAHLVAESAREARAGFRKVTHVGTSTAKVERVASNRRLLQPDGSIKVRFSSTQDPELQAAPEGLIDPNVRTVSFFDGEQALAQLHYYATHPQSYYGDGRTTYEFPGIAREKLQTESGVFQVYFTGCGGDIAAGKYNDGTPESRVRLTHQLYDGMVRSVSAVERRPVEGMKWTTHDVVLPGRKGEEYSVAHLHAIVEDASKARIDRLKSALAIVWARRAEAGEPIELSCLSLGSIRILHLPGEPMLEFQLEAQRLGGDERFVAVAGYGDVGMGYICTEEAYAQGGYEPTASLLDPSAEWTLKEGIRTLLEKAAQ